MAALIATPDFRRALVECLACGQQRLVADARHADECRRCCSLGWAFVADLSESARRAFRERNELDGSRQPARVGLRSVALENRRR
jgi:hypothetical protein